MHQSHKPFFGLSSWAFSGTDVINWFQPLQENIFLNGHLLSRHVGVFTLLVNSLTVAKTEHATFM